MRPSPGIVMPYTGRSKQRCALAHPSQSPHGTPGATSTRSPSAIPASSTSPWPGRRRSSRPSTSWPSRHGSGTPMRPATTWWSVPQTPVASSRSNAPSAGTARSMARTAPGSCSSKTRTVAGSGPAPSSVRVESTCVLEVLNEDTVNCTSSEAVWRQYAPKRCVVAASIPLDDGRGQRTPTLQSLQHRSALTALSARAMIVAWAGSGERGPCCRCERP